MQLTSGSEPQRRVPGPYARHFSYQKLSLWIHRGRMGAPPLPAISYPQPVIAGPSGIWGLPCRGSIRPGQVFGPWGQMWLCDFEQMT